MFVCMFVPYTNPHFWTDRNQTLHTSPPWSVRDRRVCMGPQYFTFPTFSTYFVGSWCRLVRSRWLPAPHCPATALYPWCGACWCDVTDGGVLCNENTEKWTECVCVKMETWWDGKEVTNELHLQLHCIYANDNVKPIFVRPSSVPCIRTTHSFTFSTFPVVPARCFANRMTTQCCQPSESRVCLCGKPQCLQETFFDLLNLFLPFWEMFIKRHDNTVIHASHMGNYTLRARGSETLQTFTFRLLKWKQRTSVTFQTDGNIQISLHIFAFLLIVEEDIVFIHDAAFFFLHVCAFASVVDPFVRNMAHISLWYISTIYPVPLFFCYIIHKIAIRFRHWSSRATPGTPASRYINTNHFLSILTAMRHFMAWLLLLSIITD